MAVRFSGSGQAYSRAAGLGSKSAFTLACWGKVAVDRNTWSTFVYIGHASNPAADGVMLQTDADGTTLICAVESSIFTGPSMGTGAWWFMAVAISGSSGTMYWAQPGATTLSSTATSGHSSTVNIANISIGTNPGFNEWVNGSVCAVKLWDAQLTRAELEREMLQVLPARTTNLLAWYPLLTPETTDYSGNGQTLSGGSGATLDAAGPPIPWGSAVLLRHRPLPASSPEPIEQETGAAGETGTATTITPARRWPIGQAAETSSSSLISLARRRGLTAAGETSTATGSSPARRLPLTTAAGETGLAQPLAALTMASVTPATEAETASPLHPVQRHSLRATLTTDTASPVRGARARPLGLASETGTTGQIQPVRHRQLAPATETDTPAGLGTATTHPLSPASETSTLATIPAHKRATIQTVGETGTAYPATPAHAHPLHPATETALPAGLGRERARQLHPAGETALAAPLAGVLYALLAQVVETGTVHTLVPVHASQLAAAAEVEAAGTLPRVKLTTVPHTSDLSTAHPVTPPAQFPEGGQRTGTAVLVRPTGTAHLTGRRVGTATILQEPTP